MCDKIQHVVSDVVHGVKTWLRSM